MHLSTFDSKLVATDCMAISIELITPILGLWSGDDIA